MCVVRDATRRDAARRRVRKDRLDFTVCQLIFIIIVKDKRDALCMRTTMYTDYTRPHYVKDLTEDVTEDP